MSSYNRAGGLSRLSQRGLEYFSHFKCLGVLHSTVLRAARYSRVTDAAGQVKIVETFSEIRSGHTRQKCCYLISICAVPSCINSSFSISCSCIRSAQTEAQSDRHLTSVLSNKSTLQKFWSDFLARTKSASRLSAHFRTQQLLGAFEKLRKATISFVISVCPQGTTRPPFDYFREIRYGYFWGKLSRKFKLN